MVVMSLFSAQAVIWYLSKGPRQALGRARGCKTCLFYRARVIPMGVMQTDMFCSPHPCLGLAMAFLKNVG